MRRTSIALVGAIVTVLAASAFAATFSVSRATWDREDRKLSVRGNGSSGATITVTNAQTGAVLGRPRVDSDGRWRITLEKPSSVPCQVQATQGSASLQRAVDGAPSSCASSSATLSSLAVTGPASVTEGAAATYVATATFSDGSRRDVTASATWSENSGYSTISAGRLTTSAVPANQSLTVTAAYSSGSVSRTGSLPVTIQDAPTPPPTATLTSLALTGPASVTEGATASYVATATFSNGSTQNVTASAAWTENSAYASIAGGVLTTTSVTSNQALSVGASFTSGTITRSASLAVTVQDVPAPTTTLTSVAVNGPASVTEGQTATYTATAMFSNGTTQNVTATAAWSENSGYSTIAAGVLTTTDVPSNQALAVTASFTSGAVTRSGSAAVTVQDVPAGPPVTGSHAGRFMTYEGTATCLNCHQNEAMAFHQSTHYQWKGDASESTGLNAGPAGKLGGINDFCIYPDINWLGKLTTTNGKIVDGGCARCHTGKGLKPTPEITQVQLENIDCLLCHSPNYKRTLELVNGSYSFVADTANMSVSLLQAASDIRKPGSDQCLNCHTKAGGGNNFKRGDLEEAHRPATATVALDVHMAPASAGGAGLACTDCHTTVGHRIAGRGVDMRQRDLLNTPVKCTNCHPAAPHTDSTLNRHTARLECNVCHVPTFAKTAATDMRRDWSLPGDLNAATGLYEPHMVLQTNVTPVYKFFNGRSQFYQFGTPAVAAANGRVLMAGPLGSVTEAGSKITALKRHEGRQPIDPVTKWLLPLKIGVFFQTADIATAITQGVAAMGWPANGSAYAETERFMGVYHEVAPKAQALGCSSCHGGTRMDFAALGYTPLTTRNNQPLCSSCHSSKTGSFTKVHQKHVTDKGYDCSTCHTFRKAL